MCVCVYLYTLYTHIHACTLNNYEPPCSWKAWFHTLFKNVGKSDWLERQTFPKKAKIEMGFVKLCSII